VKRVVLFLCLAMTMTTPSAAAQKPAGDAGTLMTIPVWPGGAPGAVGAEAADRPSLTVYLPAPQQATGTAIVVCPGGGYARQAMDHEGHQVARLLTSRGVAAFILQYRVGPRYHHPAMLQDVLEAIRLVRRRADEFSIRSDRIGVLGFSAGGHLASSAATLFDAPEGRTAATDGSTSARPDFAVLAYPVIVMGDPATTHRGSQENLLGDSASPELFRRLSTDRQVTARTPPTFLFHTDADTAVPPENSVRFYQALKAAGVPAELHIYEQGAHGVGLAPHDPALRTWPDLLFTWMRGHGFLNP
jgi:acetyl esterase/lipase